MDSLTVAPVVEPPEQEHITFDEFLTKHSGIHAEWHPDGTVEVIVTQHLRRTEIIFWLHSLLTGYFSFRRTGRIIGTG